MISFTNPARAHVPVLARWVRQKNVGGMEEKPPLLSSHVAHLSPQTRNLPFSLNQPLPPSISLPHHLPPPFLYPLTLLPLHPQGKLPRSLGLHSQWSGRVGLKEREESKRGVGENKFVVLICRDWAGRRGDRQWSRSRSCLSWGGGEVGRRRRRSGDGDGGRFVH